MTVRVRIAPSPTGDPHVGTAYAAVFNIAFARKQGGTFILRIEDTDQVRSTRQAEEMIFHSLRWLGLEWAEGPDKGGPYAPYRQSERLDIYQQYVQVLIQQGMAYTCFCSPERLDQVRRAQTAAKRPPRYDGLCRSLSVPEAETKKAEGRPWVIRLKVPEGGQTVFTDEIRGEIRFENKQIDDQVLLKADGFPTYHLANVVDDHLMKISHVIRGEEWISSTPKHILLYQAFGWDPPRFAHFPLLRRPDRAKLSKRRDPTSLKWFEEEGYLPEALINFLMLLGFSMPEGQEVFGWEEIVQNFNFDRVNTTGPVFDLQKLEWLNGLYIRRLSREEFLHRVKPLFTLSNDFSPVEKAASLIQERSKKLKEVNTWPAFFYQHEFEGLQGKDLIPKKQSREATLSLFQTLLKELETSWEVQPHEVQLEVVPPQTEDPARLEELLRAEAQKANWNPRDLFMTLRWMITGKPQSLPLCESMVILGKGETLRRIQKGIDLLRTKIEESRNPEVEGANIQSPTFGI